jgi:dihydroneopterin aldolase
MSMSSQIELMDLQLACEIGTYGPGDIVPKAHLLDLILTIDPGQVLIEMDGMDHVFDYDPLIKQIDQISRDGPYETQERLMTRIVDASAAYEDIREVEIALRKTPVLNGSGDLGVRLKLDRDALNARRGLG